ncbi:hypothetical protein BHE74_00027445 [Ensete ventricosum]|nr:hypothetical protein GW17_00021695 [Ensete ventricosum]RWW65258.1 hypothetical protein BHE74_00027445 [Ensete ventricosum]RZS22641.1 hypothetical protein BHM03_00055440 [Ensete ventricosum]
MRYCCIFATNATRRGDQPRPCHPPTRVTGHGQTPRGVVGHSHAPCRGGHPRPGAPQGQLHATRAAASRRGRPRAWLAPVGAVPTEAPLWGRHQPTREAPTGIAPAGVPVGAAARGAATPIHPLGQWRLLQRAPPVGKATANGTQHRRLHGGDDSGRWIRAEGER